MLLTLHLGVGSSIGIGLWLNGNLGLRLADYLDLSKAQSAAHYHWLS